MIDRPLLLVGCLAWSRQSGPVHHLFCTRPALLFVQAELALELHFLELVTLVLFNLLVQTVAGEGLLRCPSGRRIDRLRVATA